MEKSLSRVEMIKSMGEDTVIIVTTNTGFHDIEDILR